MARILVEPWGRRRAVLSSSNHPKPSPGLARQCVVDKRQEEPVPLLQAQEVLPGLAEGRWASAPACRLPCPTHTYKLLTAIYNCMATTL